MATQREQRRAMEDIAAKVEQIRAARESGDTAEADLLIVQCGDIARRAGVPFSMIDIDKPTANAEIEEEEYDESDSEWDSSGC